MVGSFLVAPLSLTMISVVLACGDPTTPEAKLETAGDTLDDARDDAQTARGGVSAVGDHLEVESDEAG